MSLTIVYITLFITAFLSGALILLNKKISTNESFKLLLPFSGAFLLAICVLHLIPELYQDYKQSTGVFILIGFLIQIVLEIFSKGIEHGHFHAHKTKVIHFPFALFISLCFHAIIEGMALNNPQEHIHHLQNQSLLVGIVIHKIPIAIVLVTLLKSDKFSNLVTVIALFIFSTSAPIGLFIAQQYGALKTNNPHLLMAIAVGVFLHISTTILFETSENHKFNVKKYSIIILGLIAAVLTL